MKRLILLIKGSFHKIMIALILSFIMSGIISFIVGLINLNGNEIQMGEWFKAWMIAFMIAFPTVFFISNLVSRLVYSVFKQR